LRRGVVGIGLALVAACSSSSSRSGPGDGGDGGDGEGQPVSTSCPSVPPAKGSSCAGAASCIYGSECGGTSAVCTAGQWVLGTDSIPDGGNCPPSAPDDGAACPLCMPATPCAYNAACDLDAGPSVTATCITGSSGKVWKVVAASCGPSEAGPGGGG
jgi:hypothetical protein